MGLQIDTWVPKGLSKSTDEIKHTYLLLMDYFMQWNGLTRNLKELSPHLHQLQPIQLRLQVL